MSHGKSSRSGSSKAPPHAPGASNAAQGLPSHPFSLPPGYYEYYGITPPPAVQAKKTRAPDAAVQKKDGAPAPAPGGHVDTFIGLLNTPDPIAGVGDFYGAFRFLNGLGMAEMLATLQGAADRGYLPLLLEHEAAAAHYDAPRLLAALHTVALGRTPPSSVSTSQLGEVGARIDMLTRGEQLAVYGHILLRRGVHVAVTTLMEGVLALRESDAAGAVGGLGGPGPMPAGAGRTTAPRGVEPGPWAPPGKQPSSFYLGNEAHRAIAEAYRVAHEGDETRFNNRAISSLLAILHGMKHQTEPGNLTPSELGLEPDITNLTRLHLYEIKPLADQGQGLGGGGHVCRSLQKGGHRDDARPDG